MFFFAIINQCWSITTSIVLSVTYWTMNVISVACGSNILYCTTGRLFPLCPRGLYNSGSELLWPVMRTITLPLQRPRIVTCSRCSSQTTFIVILLMSTTAWLSSHPQVVYRCRQMIVSIGSYVFVIKLSELTKRTSLCVIALLSWRQIAQSLSVTVYNYCYSQMSCGMKLMGEH